jgi:hypothetical protein
MAISLAFHIIFAVAPSLWYLLRLFKTGDTYLPLHRTQRRSQEEMKIRQGKLQALKAIKQQTKDWQTLCCGMS